MKKITVEEVESLIESLKGNLAAIARSLGVSRQTVHNRINESPTLGKALAQARETMIDNAESSLYAKVLAGDITAIIFFLKTQGKRRGYSDSGESDRIIAAIYQEITRLGLQGLITTANSSSGDSDTKFVN